MKNRFAITVVLLILALLGSLCVTGCAFGNKRILDQTRTKQIKVGETTKYEVAQILGKPRHKFRHTSQGKTTEIWMYIYHKERATFLDFATGGLVGVLLPQHSDTYSFYVMFSETGAVENIKQNSMSQ
jgi:outer membrane protein assembly factor BamE (lipoprotein component of BamABCDE complex)